MRPASFVSRPQHDRLDFARALRERPADFSSLVIRSSAGTWRIRAIPAACTLTLGDTTFRRPDRSRTAST